MKALPSGRWAEAIVRRRGRLAAAWVVAALMLLPATRRIESRLGAAARVEGSESAIVDEQLVRRFRSPLAHPLVLVASGIPSPVSPEGDSALRMIADSLHTMPGVTRVLSYLDGGDPLFVGSDGSPRSGTVLIVAIDERRPGDRLLDTLHAATASWVASLRERYPHIALQWTGEVALNAEIRRTSAADARRAELQALPASFALLLVAFGAVVASFLPIGVAVLAIAISLGMAAVVAQFWTFSIILQNVVTMIGLGLGIDYSLLVVQRFRAELSRERDSKRAARDALAAAGPTILLSGASVAIGFCALSALPVNELRSVAVGGLLVTVISVLLATTLLPGVLAELGSRVDWGRIANVKQRSRSPWHGWAALVTRRPLLVLCLAGLPVGALAWQARRLATGQPRGDWLPRTMESAQALRELGAMGRGAVVQTIRVTLELPPGVTAVDDSGWAATTRLARGLVGDSVVARVRSLPGLIAPLGSTLPRAALLEAVPEDIRSAFVSRDGRVAVLEVIPREGATPAQLAALVMRIRGTAVGAAHIRAGGLPALNVDYEHAVGGGSRMLEVVSLVVAATFLILAIGFRSVIVPLKAIALNLLAVAGAFGAVTLVFQDGIGARALGVAAPLDAVFPAIPMLVFCVVFGLSMDYEVFLVARIREARLRGDAERDAIADGLAHTGRLITSAAGIMTVVFGAFVFADFLLIKMLGFALAVAVVLDATVMRLAVSPALLAIAGRWNWWPGGRVSQHAGGTVDHLSPIGAR